jgi:hypothetical protein
MKRDILCCAPMIMLPGLSLMEWLLTIIERGLTRCFTCGDVT